jgi:hypothetical protein
MPNPVNRQPATPESDEGCSSTTQKAVTANSCVVNLKPHAAYILGYASSIVRLLQFLCWSWRGELNTEGSVQEALKALREAIAVLGDELPPSAIPKLTKVCEEIDAITRRGNVIPRWYEPDWADSFRLEDSPGYREWNELMSLAQSALPKESPWYLWLQLGMAIASYQTEITVCQDDCTVRSMQSLQPILDCAVALFECGYGTIPEIARLADYVRNQRWRPQTEILAQAVETPDADLDRELGPRNTGIILLGQIIDLYQRIQLALSTLAPSSAKSSAQLPAPAEIPPLVPSMGPRGAIVSGQTDNVADRGKGPALRLVVDVQKRIAHYDGEVINLDKMEVACYVAALVDAKGDWQGPADITERYPAYANARADRLKKRVPHPIRDLIETQGAKGSRIRLDRLLPQ